MKPPERYALIIESDDGKEWTASLAHPALLDFGHGSTPAEAVTDFVQAVNLTANRTDTQNLHERMVAWLRAARRFAPRQQGARGPLLEAE